MSRPIRTAILLGLSACAGGPRTYLAPSNLTVTASVEDPAGEAPAHIIYVDNASSDPVEVRSVTLFDCENINLRCNEPIRIRMRLEPGTRRPVLRVQPDNRARGHSFRFHYAWHGLGGSDVSQVEQIDTALIAPIPMRPPTQMRGRPLAVGLDSLVMVVGERMTFPSLSRAPGDTATSTEPLLVVGDQTIASVAGGRELFALRPGRTDLMIRAPGGLMRMPLIVRASPTGAGVAELLVQPDSLVLRVGERLNLSQAVRVEMRRPSGALVPTVGWSLYVEDESIVKLGAGELIGQRAGRTAVVFGIEQARARVPVIVKP